MVIDFHTHIFPNKIAKNSIEALEREGHVKPNTDGTLKGLKLSMQEAKIDYSVVLPVCTKPSQFESINAYAESINNQNGILSFGGIHPDHTDIDEGLLQIKQMGLKGVKLHPDYQDTYINDEKYYRIIRKCMELDLCMVIHAGMDVGRPIPIHCPPDRTFLMLRECLKDCQKDSKIVLAHLGGMMQWELVEHLLVGKNIYLDLAFCNILASQEQILRIIEKHGADRILFATDSPWSSQKDAVSFIETLPLSQNDKDFILYKNAKRILGL